MLQQLTVVSLLFLLCVVSMFYALPCGCMTGNKKLEDTIRKTSYFVSNCTCNFIILDKTVNYYNFKHFLLMYAF